MGNTFGAHIFKRRQAGEREEVKLKLFNPDGEPFSLASAVLEAWQGDYVDTLDYEVGSLVRRDGSTYLALSDAPHTLLGPGETTALVAAQVMQISTQRNGYALPRDVVATLADLVGGGGYNMGGNSRWFRIFGEPGEAVTLSAVGVPDPPEKLHLYGADGNNAWQGGANFAFPKTVVVPGDGWFGIEVHEAITSIKYVGPDGPQPIPGSPWTLFA